MKGMIYLRFSVVNGYIEFSVMVLPVQGKNTKFVVKKCYILDQTSSKK